MDDTPIGLDQKSFDATARVVRHVLRTQQPLPKTRRRQTQDVTIDGGSGAGCGCCGCFNCISKGVVGGCPECPNGAPLQFTVNFGYWRAFPALGDSFDLNYGLSSDLCGESSSSSSSSSGSCLWSSCLIEVDGTFSSSSSTGVYQWVFTGGEIRLTHVSGGDVVGLAHHPVVYLPTDGIDCLCSTKFRASNPSKFPQPDGLNCEICLIPIEPPTDCCCNCFRVEFTGVTGIVDNPPNCTAALLAAGPQNIDLTEGGCQCVEQPCNEAIITIPCYWRVGLVDVSNPYAVLGIYNDGITRLNILFRAIGSSSYCQQSYECDDFDCDGGTFTNVSTTSGCNGDCSGADAVWPATLNVVAIPCESSSSSSSSSSSISSSSSYSSSSSSATPTCGTCTYFWDGLEWTVASLDCDSPCNCLAPVIAGTFIGEHTSTNCA